MYEPVMSECVYLKYLKTECSEGVEYSGADA
jgi:hypothetical protein